ncbi:MAG: hypothetical protein AB7H96_10500 [Vicinamibacterales bacterium]
MKPLDVGLGLRLLRFLRTPKGTVLAILVCLVAGAPVVRTGGTTLLWLAPTVLCPALVDAAVLRWRRGRLVFPGGAAITGLLVGMVLRVQEPWYVATALATAAVALKYPLRVRHANVFNPAALALVAASQLFGAGHSWWGALTEVVPAAAIPLLLASAAFITVRVHKLPLVLAFTGTYYVCCLLTAVLVDPALVADLFVPPDLQATIFFAGFFLTDPPTSPTRRGAQVTHGVVVAVASMSALLATGMVDYLFVGVLVGNVWEAGHRLLRTRMHVRLQARTASP